MRTRSRVHVVIALVGGSGGLVAVTILIEVKVDLLLRRALDVGLLQRFPLDALPLLGELYLHAVREGGTHVGARVC